MEIAGLALIYVSGIITGFIGAMLFIMRLGRKSLDRKKNELGKKPESVGSRMRRVKEITTEQLALQSQTSLPQKNALHGRYKNGLIGRIKELEEQKTEILKSIIVDGFDPEITVVDEAGVVTTLKLSKFLADSGITIPPKKEEKPPAPPQQRGRFFVHKGGKDDGTTH